MAKYNRLTCTITEAAEMLGVCRAEVRRMIKRGILAEFPTTGRGRVMVSLLSILEALEYPPAIIRDIALQLSLPQESTGEPTASVTDATHLPPRHPSTLPGFSTLSPPPPKGGAKAGMHGVPAAANRKVAASRALFDRILSEGREGGKKAKKKRKTKTKKK